MRICGVDIQGSEAIICILHFKDGLFSLPDCRAKKVVLDKQNKTKDLIYFQQTFAKLMEDYQVEKVIIKERPLKGKFAGGALGFKIEAAIQLIQSIEVETLSPIKMKEAIKQNPIPVEFSETGLKAFQENAFKASYIAHIQTSRKS